MKRIIFPYQAGVVIKTSGGCDDGLADTRLHIVTNCGCNAPDTKSHCQGTPIMMTMNHMNYINDAGKYIYSSGQK